jgi:hypothetical protein
MPYRVDSVTVSLSGKFQTNLNLSTDKHFYDGIKNWTYIWYSAKYSSYLYFY